MKQLAYIVLILTLAGCAGAQYSSDPETAAVQKWTDTCRTYGETLKLVNDSIELRIITRDGDTAKAMGEVKLALSPICTADAPPAGIGREEIQRLLDAQLRRLILIKQEIPQ